jgi:hypothetical protein
MAAFFTDDKAGANDLLKTVTGLYQTFRAEPAARTTAVNVPGADAKAQAQAAATPKDASPDADSPLIRSSGGLAGAAVGWINRGWAFVRANPLLVLAALALPGGALLLFLKKRKKKK